MSDDDIRAKYIANLRALADFLEANPDLPVPYSTSVSYYPSNLDDARKIRRGTTGWVKENDPDSNYVNYVRQFGDGEELYGSVTYEICVNKANTTCRRVQIGERHVPAHDEPVYAWQCDDQPEGVEQ